MSTALDQLVNAAAKRLGQRPSLTAPVVDVIVRRHRKGHSPRQISAHLQGVFVADAPQAQTDFVKFVVDQL
jgi:hypothetical protein